MILLNIKYFNIKMTYHCFQNVL